MARIAAVAWDIDGTLVDSEPLHLVALAEVCDRYGYDVRVLPDDHFRGVHLPDVWTALRPSLPGSADRDRWMDEIMQAYIGRAGELVLQPGVREVVALLAERGIRQVCVSNSSRPIVDANIEALGIAQHLDFSISLDDVTEGKPDPEPYRRACERLGLDPAQVAAVEDSRTGAISARAAGLFVIGFDTAGEILPDVDWMLARLDELPPRLAAATAHSGAGL